VSDFLEGALYKTAVIVIENTNLFNNYCNAEQTNILLILPHDNQIPCYSCAETLDLTQCS